MNFLFFLTPPACSLFQICSSFLCYLCGPNYPAQPCSLWLEALCACPIVESRQLIAGIIRTAYSVAAKADREAVASVVKFTGALLSLLEGRSELMNRGLLHRLNEAFDLMRDLANVTRDATTELIRSEGFKRIAMSVARLCEDENGEDVNGKAEAQVSNV